MNFLLYSQYFYPVPGGTQSFVLQLARGIVSAPSSGQAAASAAPAAPNLVTLVTQTPGAADSSQPFRVVRRPGLRGLFRLMRSADIVHVAGPALAPLALGFFLRSRLFVEHHGCQVSCPNGLLFYEPDRSPCPGHYMARRYHKCVACNRSSLGLLRSLRMLLLTPVRRWLSNRAAANIMPTAWLASELKLRRMTVIHHGISPAQISSPLEPISGPSSASASSPPQSPKSGAVPTFAFQGRLVSTKGVATLLHAARLLHNEGRAFRLKILGDGPEAGALRARASGLESHVEFLGHVSDDRLDAAFSDVSAVVMPSLGGEVFGLVAAENMLRGKLVIVSDLGALSEVVGPAGLVFPAGDAAALAACLRRVLDDPSLAVSLGAAARARALELFSLPRMLVSHLVLYRQSLP
jgi:glycosyltransferase involved in cell wall biosynthesis